MSDRLAARRRFTRLTLALFGLLIVGLAFWRLTLDPGNRAWAGALLGQIDRSRLIITDRAPCPGAPFVLPADGFVGLLYADPRGPYSTQRPHQGIDIFSNAAPGQTPVYAAMDGYISREVNWVSALIQRIPNDPLQPNQQIWLYYAHMADAGGQSFIESVFTPGVREVFVEQGTLLGYTGNYNGPGGRPLGTHLHFSIVLDNGNGRYLNELDFANTLDPTRYLRRDVVYQGVGAADCLES